MFGFFFWGGGGGGGQGIKWWGQGENGVNKLHCESFDNFYEKYKKLSKKINYFIIFL